MKKFKLLSLIGIISLALAQAGWAGGHGGGVGGPGGGRRRRARRGGVAGWGSVEWCVDGRGWLSGLVGLGLSVWLLPVWLLWIRSVPVRLWIRQVRLLRWPRLWITLWKPSGLWIWPWQSSRLRIP